MDDDPHETTRASEFSAIARWLKQSPTEGAAVLRGAGEDVAWIGGDEPLALSVDTLVDGVHFRRSWMPPEAVGWKAMTAALSDLAAARARPVGCLVALSAPALDSWTDAVMAGIAEAARRFACPLLGGDTTRSAVATISVTVIGAGTPFGRSGARVGDLVQLSGPTGLAARALRGLEAGQTVPAEALLRPVPRLDLRDALSAATACVDLSDGLLADAGHLAEASAVQIVLDREALQVEGVSEADALAGGEDYELLATAPRPLPGFQVVGAVRAGAGVSFDDGSPLPDRRGWDHGA